MREKKALLIIALALCVTISACANQTGELTFEQIMSVENIESSQLDAIEYENFKDMISNYRIRGVDPSAVSGYVTKVTYYLSWNNEDMIVSGYTITELTVKNVNEAYNGLSLSENESISLKQDYYVCFKNTTDFVDFMSANTQKKVKSIDDLANVDSCVLQLIPLDGTEYVKHIPEDELPMKIGESYSMIVYKVDGNDDLGCYYIMPNDEALTYDALNREYGLRYSSTYTSIANEIEAYFQ